MDESVHPDLNVTQSSYNNSVINILGTFNETVTDRITDWTSVTWMIMATVLTVIGNVSICWIVHVTSSLQTSHNKFVLNLAWCDLLMSVLHGPAIIIALIHDDWILGQIACQLYGFMTSLFGIASLLTLAVISLNRCCMIVYTTRVSHLFSSRKTSAYIVGVWLFAALCSFPPTVGWSQYSFIRSRALCTIRWSTDFSYTITVITLGVVIPLLLMIVAYARIFVKMKAALPKVRQTRKITDAIRSVKVASQPMMTNDDVTIISRESNDLSRDSQPTSFGTDKASIRTRPSQETFAVSWTISRHVDNQLATSNTQKNLKGTTTNNSALNALEPCTNRNSSSIQENTGDNKSSPEPQQKEQQNQEKQQKLKLKLPQKRQLYIERQYTNNQPPEKQLLQQEMHTVQDGQKFLCREQEEEELAELKEIKTARPRLPSIRSPSRKRRLIHQASTASRSHSLDSNHYVQRTAWEITRDDIPLTNRDYPTKGDVIDPSIGCNGAEYRVECSTSGMFARDAMKNSVVANCCQDSVRRDVIHRHTRIHSTGDLLEVSEAATALKMSSLIKKDSSDEERRRKKSQQQPKHRLADELRVSLTLLVVLLLFIVSWAPLSFVNFVETIGWTQLPLPRWVDRTAVCMMYVQSAVNPVIYGVMNKNFRGGYAAIFKCCSINAPK